MADKLACCVRIFSGRRDDMRGHMCSRVPSLEYEGKHYCKLHYPPNEQWRRAAQGAKWEAERKEQHAEREVKVRIEQSHPNLIAALRPFVAFLEAFEARPISGLDRDEIYGIHGGYKVEGGASIRWEHLRAARAALREAEGTE